MERRHRIGAAFRASCGGGRGWLARVACRAEAYTMAGEFDDAETVLAIENPPRDARPHVALGLARTFYLQGRTGDACGPRAGAALGGRRCVRRDAFLNVCGETSVRRLPLPDEALKCTGVDDFSAMLAATVKTIAAGELGRADEVSPTATFVRAVGAAPPSTGLLRFALAEAHSTALQLLGWADAADAVNRIRDDDQPSDVYRWVEMMTGSVNLGRGRIDLAVQTVA